MHHILTYSTANSLLITHQTHLTNTLPHTNTTHTVTVYRTHKHYTHTQYTQFSMDGLVTGMKLHVPCRKESLVEMVI